MTYPGPYSPPSIQPQWGYPPSPDLFRAARRASIFVFIVGVLVALLGILYLLLFNSPIMLDSMRKSLAKFDTQVISFDTLKVILHIFAAMIVVVGIVLLALGVWVRKGSRAGATTTLVLCSVMAIISCCGTFQSVGMVSGPRGIGPLLANFGQIALLMATIIALTKAIGEANHRNQWAAWQQYQYTQPVPAPQMYAPPMQPPSAPPPPQG